MIGDFGTLGSVIVGGLMGFVFSYFLGIWHDNRIRRGFAGDHLWNAFEPEVIVCDPTSVTDNDFNAYAILMKAYPRHLAAIRKFERVLSCGERIRFEQAWHEYACYEGKTDYPFLEQYASRGVGLEEAKKNRALALRRIEGILSFAK